MPEQQDLNDLAYFAWVVDAGGFAPAGRRHGVPKSKLSRRIKALEERLGVRLLQRSTRRFSVTSTGETFYRHCKAVLQEAEAAHEAVNLRHGEPCGVVRLSCPVTLLHFAIGDMLNDFLRMYPRVSVELDADNRRVDVIGEGMDVALRVRFPPLKDSDLVMRKLVQATRSWWLRRPCWMNWADPRPPRIWPVCRVWPRRRTRPTRNGSS